MGGEEVTLASIISVSEEGTASPPRLGSVLRRTLSGFRSPWMMFLAWM